MKETVTKLLSRAWKLTVKVYHTIREAVAKALRMLIVGVKWLIAIVFVSLLLAYVPFVIAFVLMAMVILAYAIMHTTSEFGDDVKYIFYALSHLKVVD